MGFVPLFWGLGFRMYSRLGRKMLEYRKEPKLLVE